MNLLLPAAWVQRFDGVKEVIPAPQPAVQPRVHRHASRLGANRMVLAGAGLPQPASGPGRLLIGVRLEWHLLKGFSPVTPCYDTGSSNRQCFNFSWAPAFAGESE